MDHVTAILHCSLKKRNINFITLSVNLVCFATGLFNDIDENKLIKTNEYERLELDRYYFDKTNKRIMF